MSKQPSDYCCLNFGCENPEMCNKLGFPCGWPGSKAEWDALSSEAQALHAKGPGYEALAEKIFNDGGPA